MIYGQLFSECTVIKLIPIDQTQVNNLENAVSIKGHIESAVQYPDHKKNTFESYYS